MKRSPGQGQSQIDASTQQQAEPEWTEKDELYNQGLAVQRLKEGPTLWPGLQYNRI